MRETKYRAWDKEDKRMIVDEQNYVPLIVTNKGVMKLNPYHKENLWSIVNENRFNIMQCTGVKDEDGNEIYGGDVLELYLNDYGEIEKPEKFIVNCDKKFFSDVCYLQQIEAHINQSDTNDYIKIVGNIYDNPELVTS